MALSLSDPMVTKPFRILDLKRETQDTYNINLEPVQKKGSFTFSPGQFNMLYAFGGAEVPISISGDPTQSAILTHTVRSIGSTTNVLCASKKGSYIGVRGPFGKGWPLEDALGSDVIIVTGGIGIASIRPAIYYLLANRKKYGKIVVLYGARTPEEILFKKDLEKWRGRFDLDVQVTVDSAPTGWHGNVALVTSLIPKAVFDPYHAVALIAGPEIMMRFALSELSQRGVMDSKIFMSMERNMKCGIGLCGHCQFGPFIVCKNGPVFCFSDIRRFFEKREV